MQHHNIIVVAAQNFFLIILEKKHEDRMTNVALILLVSLRPPHDSGYEIEKTKSKRMNRNNK